jgi:hypothetical protein
VIHYSLLSEIIFTNDAAFNSIDTATAKILKCVCKNAGSNKNIKMKLDVYKARYYYDKVVDIINSVLEFKTSRNIELRENHSLNLTDFITEFAKENAEVNDGFRELVVIKYKWSLYYYTDSLKYGINETTYETTENTEWFLEQCV